ncbi:MAG: restriction endonuclease [Muribaculaceae bacterium]|nr:restriction endonuclease [Muribaculaceae bacterium]
MVTEYSFTNTIRKILTSFYGDNAEAILEGSLLIQYLNKKTKSANKGSKARGSFANIYSIYVVVEDYIRHDYHKAEKGKYADYEGAMFSYLLKRQRELPFGAKLQNHSLNNRTNSEFQDSFPTTNLIPIIRNQETNRYWVNDNLLWIVLNRKHYNIAEAIIAIIDEYIKTKLDSFERFVNQCEQMQTVGNEDKEGIKKFILSLLAPNVDARLFEIVSYSILKFYYIEQNIYWGYELEKVKSENLKLYKTGRTNANDGGIDFVMKPLGRFFQVTETIDFKKYFLDIEKIEKYPITFVIKSNESISEIKEKLESDALKTYPVKAIVTKYLGCIEEIINIPILMNYLQTVEKNGLLIKVLDEIVLQSKVEFNYSDEDED